MRKSNFSISFLLILSFYFFCINLYSIQKNISESKYSSYFSQAETYRKAGEFKKSIEFFTKSLKTAKQIPDKEKESESILKLGLMYWNIGQLKRSSDYYKQALSLAKKFNLKDIEEVSSNALEIYRLYTKGKKYRSSGQYQKSIDSFQKAIHLSRKIKSKEREVKNLRQLSLTYLELSNFKKFLTINKEALKIAQELGHKKEEGRCLINIGLFYRKMGDYSRALNYYNRALKIAQTLKNKNIESACINNIGIIYGKIGNYYKALEYLTQTLSIDKQLGDYVHVAMDLNNIGETFRSKGLIAGNEKNYYKALDYFNKSYSLVKKTGDNKTEIEVLNNIGTVHTDLKNYKQALKYFRLGYKKAEEIQYRRAMSMILNNMGIVYFNQGNYEESTKYYQKAIDLALEIRGGQILWEAYLELANAYAKQEEFKKALESYKNSIAIIEDIRSRIKLEELKASYFGTDKRIEAYHNLIDLLVNLNHSYPEKHYDSQAFNYLERAKARAFLDSLEISQVNISRGIDFKLLNEEKELMKEISKLYTKLLAAELSLSEKNDIYEKLKAYEDKLEILKREIRTKSPAYANLKYPEIITLKEVQKKILDKKTAFFAYIVGKEKSYLFVITKNDLKIFSIPPRDKLQKQVSDYLKVITDKDNKNFQLGYTLFCKLVLPGLNKNIKKLIFIPDDILHFLPFGALITHEKEKSWLIKNYKIAYVPSISSFREITKRKKSKRKKPQMDILAFGDPYFGHLEAGDDGNDIFQKLFSSNAFNSSRLKYSSLEIQRITSLFKKTKTKSFQRKMATEEQLKAMNLADYKIIHFATHSLIDDKRPARSSIVLSLDKDPKEDGFLQMREVYNLKLNADLVVLSACQTGLGQFIKGEGIEGLNRAFFYAGTSAVLMSLWSINDQASAQLMERFYHHLRSGESIMKALQDAKLEMISSNILSHPYYWAGFIVSGNAEKVIFPKTLSRWILFGFSAFLGFGIIMVVVRRIILTG